MHLKPEIIGYRKNGAPVYSIMGGATPLAQDRLVRKEVALGTIREYDPPEDHIVLSQLAPFLDVESDDVIFDYTRGMAVGMADARAEDAESELAQKDNIGPGTGRASTIDWAVKDHYDPSDISRYRESLIIQGLTANQENALNLQFTGRAAEEFAAKLARDERRRRRMLDNRIEWLGTQALETGGISYNNGKIKFTVTFARPGGQVTTVTNLWSTADGDPIGDILGIKQIMLDTYGITLNRAITSQRVINSIMTSAKFNSAGGVNSQPHPFYTVDGWGPEAARRKVEQVTGVNFQINDSVWRSRNIGSTTITNHRFLSDNKIYFLPSEQDIAALDDTEIGFAKTLTSPHVEGNWQTRYYEWEKDTGPDPWGLDRGTGIKAFPVFPHLNLTWVLTVLAP